jgi:hypothetical protein
MPRSERRKRVSRKLNSSNNPSPSLTRNNSGEPPVQSHQPPKQRSSPVHFCDPHEIFGLAAAGLNGRTLRGCAEGCGC